MPKDDTVYLGHMLDTARRIASRMEGKTQGDFEANEDLRIVTAHLIQTIGEAAGRVSQQCRASHPEIRWRQIVGIRHRIVHDYMDVDYDVLWEVVAHDLLPLIEALENVIPPEAQ